jgi:hypothetical protein
MNLLSDGGCLNLSFNESHFLTIQFLILNFYKEYNFPMSTIKFSTLDYSTVACCNNYVPEQEPIDSNIWCLLVCVGFVNVTFEIFFKDG